MAKETSPKYNEILCIGLGLSGVCLGVQLQRKLGFTDIHFYDRNVSHSGTWQANRYPGCACDVSAIYYSFSFETNPDWSRMFPSNDEIRAYLDGVVDKYHLHPRMTFQTECESAVWDGRRGVWTVTLRDLVNGTCYTHECRILFSAVGSLVDPKYPDIPGSESFEGQMFHTAKWREDVDLKDKHTIVVGNGCSATQVVPIITPLTKTLTQFINTPHWLIERTNPSIGPAWRWAFRHIPLFTRLVRLIMFVLAENGWRLFIMNKSGARLRRQGEEDSKAFIYRMAPKKYHDILIPKWEFACKRRIFDNDALYLQSLHAPTLHLTTDPVLEILPHAVRTASHTYPADVIVLATGFQTNNGLGSLRVQGREGEWLDEHWRRMGGPGAYNNTAVHGFPNFMMLYGPNSSTGHNSVLFTIECQVNYALDIIRPLIRREADEVEVADGAEKRHARELQAASGDKLWNTCKNWYVTNGWNSTTYPWSQCYFWWRSTFPVRSDWTYKYTPLHARRVRRRRVVLLLVLFILAFVGGAFSRGGYRKLGGVREVVSAVVERRRGWVGM